MKNNISIYRFTFLFVAFISTLSFSFAQKTPAEEKKTLKQARKLLENEKYSAAQEKYQKLVALNPTNDEYNFEAGLSYYLANNERANSIPYFEAALKNSKEDTIPELYYYLARAYHLNSEFDKSKEAFYKFQPQIKTNSIAGRNLIKETDQFIDKNKNGETFLISKNKQIEIKNLGANINTEYGEYAPVFRGNDNILLFTSRRQNSSFTKLAVDLQPYEDIYAAKKNGDSWSLISEKNELAKYLPNEFNTKKHDAGIIYSDDGKKLYTYKTDRIWESSYENNNWSELTLLNKNINTSKYNVPSVSLSADGKTIFFVAYRKDGIGDKDIYVSTLNAEGNWSEAKHLGENINTKFDEEAPYLSKDGKTLYFSSKGHDGIGGFDIFKSNLVNGEWSKPINMGIPVNSPDDDLFLVIDKDEKNGFFSSSRNGGLGGLDIYSIAPVKQEIKHIINGLIVNEQEQPINNSMLNFKKTNPDSILAENQPILENGIFNLVASTQGTHKIDINAKNYLPQSIQFSLPKESTTSNLKVTLTKIETEKNNLQLLNVVSDELGLNLTDTMITPKTATNDNIVADNNKKGTGENNDLGILLASYQEYFNYNIKEINTSNPNYIDLINKAVKQVNAKGKIYIDIESSSSKVPTKTYKSNQNLSKLRLSEAQEIIISSLVTKGIAKENIIINDTKSLVQGPKYVGDYKNESKYKDFQYIIIRIK